MNKLNYLIVAFALLLGNATSGLTAEHEWTFQTSAQAGDNFFVIEQEWADKVEEASGGRVSIELLPVNAVVQYNETLDAVGAGILSGHITDPSYFSGKDPAFALIGNMVGAWGHPFEMREFLEEGGGYEIYRELLAQYNLYLIGAAWTGVEALISKKPINSVEEFKGVKIRAPEGLVQEVFMAIGAAPVNLPGSEAYSALEKGVVDAADYTVFSTNQALGFHKVAPYPIYPGFHSMPVVEVAMNLEIWQSLPEDLQKIITEQTRWLGTEMVTRLDELDKEAVKEAEAQDVNIINWPEEERKKFRAIAQEQWKKWAERSAMAQKWYDAVTAWLQEKGKL